MRLLLDTDALIKLHRAGVLERVAEAYACGIHEAVYREAVVAGRAHRYADAEIIDQVVQAHIEVHPAASAGDESRETRGLRLGQGEGGLLELYVRDEGDLIVSDDHRFLSVLLSRGVPVLLSSGLIARLARDGVISPEEAKVALDKVKPWISRGAHREATDEIEGG